MRAAERLFISQPALGAAVRPRPRRRPVDGCGGGAAASCPRGTGRVGPGLGGSRTGQEQAAGDPSGGNEHQPGTRRPAGGDQVPVHRRPPAGDRVTPAGQLGRGRHHPARQ
ncbi:MAG TPA: hypothetical protein VG142_18785 [Trebonia sp.]|nr:hypothetical protein [Trebonia sp.]